MIRLRMNGLMSRASTLALVAAIGSVGSAAAGTTVLGPGPVNHVYNTSPTNFVNINLGATVAVGPQGNSFTNDPGIIILNPTGTGVQIDDSSLLGTFTNNGSIVGQGLGFDGVNIDNALLNAGFVNNGLIQGSSDGYRRTPVR